MKLPLRLPTIFMALYQIASVRMRRMGMGIGLFLVSAIVGSVGIIAALSSMFFSLAKMPEFIAPSLITGLIAILISILVSVQAYSMVKK